MKTQVKLTVRGARDYAKEVDIMRRVYGLHLHHVSTKAGYVSRKLECVREEYRGKFGDGYILLRPRYDTQRYVTCEYWVK